MCLQESIADFLAADGYEVWVIDLRGNGKADKQSRVDLEFEWNIDDYLVQVNKTTQCIVVVQDDVKGCLCTMLVVQSRRFSQLFPAVQFELCLGIISWAVCQEPACRDFVIEWWSIARQQLAPPVPAWYEVGQFVAQPILFKIIKIRSGILGRRPQLCTLLLQQRYHGGTVARILLANNT